MEDKNRTRLQQLHCSKGSIAYYTCQSLGIHQYFYNKQDFVQPNVSLNTVLEILLRTSTFMSSFPTAQASYSPLLSY